MNLLRTFAVVVLVAGLQAGCTSASSWGPSKQEWAAMSAAEKIAYSEYLNARNTRGGSKRSNHRELVTYAESLPKITSTIESEQMR